MRRDVTVGAAYDGDSQTMREGRREREKGEERQSFFGGNAMTNGLSECLTPFLSFSLAASRSLCHCSWGKLEMLIAEMKYFGDKRVPDEPPL